MQSVIFAKSILSFTHSVFNFKKYLRRKYPGVDLNVEQTSELCRVDDSASVNISGKNEDVELVMPCPSNTKPKKKLVPVLTSSNAINQIQGKISSCGSIW